ncbi:MAG: hypothetical protein NXI22_05915 [bacterium]|nr:hypothetical protein [bacterium]
MKAILLTTDLLGSSQVAAGAPVGSTVATIGSMAGFTSTIEEEPIRLVMLDLAANGFDLAEVVAVCKRQEPPTAVIAYGPHVHEAKLQQAREAGCDHVLTRGQMVNQSREILQSFA